MKSKSLTRLKSIYPTGPDKIPAFPLNDSESVSSYSVTMLLNLDLKEGTFPSRELSKKESQTNFNYY